MNDSNEDNLLFFNWKSDGLKKMIYRYFFDLNSKHRIKGIFFLK